MVNIENESKRKLFMLFEEKAKELYESAFSKTLTGSGVEVKWEKDKGFTTTRIGPNYEAIKSFVITFRNFTLDTDPISIRNISKIYEKLETEKPVRKEFFDARKKFNDFLDSYSIFEIDGKKLTNRIIIDTYIYGDVIHLEKHDEFKDWINHNPKKEFMFNEIVYILGTAGNFIYYFNSINKRYLESMAQ